MREYLDWSYLQMEVSVLIAMRQFDFDIGVESMAE